MAETTISIDKLIDIVSRGGCVKTGVDVFNDNGVLLLEKNVPVHSINPLLVIKKYGVGVVSINLNDSGGLWDESGKQISLTEIHDDVERRENRLSSDNLEKRIKEIGEQKIEAEKKYKKAKTTIKKIVSDIKDSDGEFDAAPIEDTVNDIINVLVQNDTAFSHLTREIFSYDDYLYNHSTSVCTIATAVLIRFNEKFGDIINNFLSTISIEGLDSTEITTPLSFIYHPPNELHQISMGYFLHDVGKVLVPDNVLNKNGKLTDDEFEIVKGHSFIKGFEILEKNKLITPYIVNSVKYHHGQLFMGENKCYPDDIHPIELPPYVKICKLADIYDAMTSKRSYKEAFNPVGVVAELYRKYANKDRMLQFILSTFVKIVGIYPPGSILFLKNGQMVYVLDSEGPIVIPFTDNDGCTMKNKSDPIELNDAFLEENDEMNIDRQKPLKSPLEVYDVLPSYLQSTVH